MGQANLALRFLLELVAIVAVGYWGYNAASGALRWVLAVGAPAALIAVWALVIAPGANVPIGQDVRMVLGTGVLLVAAAALYLAGQATAAAALAVVIVVNTVLLFVFRA